MITSQQGAIKTNFCEWSCLTKKEYRNLSLRRKNMFNKICGVVI